MSWTRFIFVLYSLYFICLQVSVLLHPYVVVSGTSLDLPIIAENLREESLAELEVDDDDEARAHYTDCTHVTEPRPKRKTKAYSQDNLVEDQLEPIIVQAGPSSHPDPPIPSLPTTENETTNPDIKCRKVCPNRLSLHHSLILSDNTSFPTDNNEAVNRCIQKSHSTHSFCQVADDNVLDTEMKDSLRHTYSVGSRVGEDTEDPVPNENFCDTNIRHNDRYPEANDVDSLDNEIMDALTLETGNLPDLSEEQSSSLDDSTRHDFWTESLSAENLNYLNRLLSFDQDGAEGQSLEAEWEASGEGCEHLHLVLKYWNYLALPYPELRQAVSWGQVRCYCGGCQPDAQPPLAGNLQKIQCII